MYDLIVVGGGPAGAATAQYVHKQGKRVLLLEKSNFPRFQIGESLLPFSMEVFEDLGFDKVLASGNYLKKKGALFIDSRQGDSIYFDFSDGGKAAYPHAYEVQRAQFDHDFLNHAIKAGVEVHQPEEFCDLEINLEGVMVTTDKGQYRSKFIVDATGGKSQILRKFESKEKNELYYNNFSIYAHFEGVSRDNLRDRGDITIGILHDNSWAWLIPFEDGSTSVGIVSSRTNLPEISDPEGAFTAIIDKNSWLSELMSSANRSSEFKVVSNYSYKCDSFVGERWGSVGDSMSFLDPVFSSGVHVSLMSAKLLSQNIVYSLENEGCWLNSEDNVVSYNAEIKKGITRFNNLLQMFYGGDFLNRVKSLEKRDGTRSAITAAIAGGVWCEDNILIRMGLI
ncbi:MAG: NAD(P)-binding protein [Bacteriovoracaceae bacterium]|nr:NAD(P)-binding protein [Bacteriovoracaceae bacterium]